MTASSLKDTCLDRLTELCLALPEAVCQHNGQHATFLVRDKKFAYYLVDHHGDGVVGLCCRAAPGLNEVLIASDPARFYMPAYVGPRGWVGLRLDLGEIDWAEVAEMITDSYRLAAPKRLAAFVHQPPA